MSSAILRSGRRTARTAVLAATAVLIGVCAIAAQTASAASPYPGYKSCGSFRAAYVN
jgi:hypothetical protein